QAAEQGEVGPKMWHQISLLPEADRDGVLEMYRSRVPAAQVADVIARKKRQAPAAGPAVTVGRIKCEVPGKGATVVVSGTALSIDDLIATLTELLALAKREAQKGVCARTFERVCRDLAKKA
ncbi:MAG: ParB/RepB/Spo0J family partition protein, partial [Gemmataceae bacterium]